MVNMASQCQLKYLRLRRRQIYSPDQITFLALSSRAAIPIPCWYFISIATNFSGDQDKCQPLVLFGANTILAPRLG